MGYTRYWTRTDKPLTEEFVTQVRDIVEDAERRGIKICGWDGYGEPEISLEKISLNGNGEQGLDHETFYLNGKGEKIEDRGDWGFCKTARKPYDYAVRMILKIAEEDGYVVEVESDGENEQIYSDEQYLSGKV